GSMACPYTMPGTFPAARSFRAAPLPSASRGSAFSVLSMTATFLVPRAVGSAPRGGGTGFDCTQDRARPTGAGPGPAGEPAAGVLQAPRQRDPRLPLHHLA